MSIGWLGGLALGFFGSLHCVGMCGPLVLALPGKSARWQKFLTLRLLYNLGRILSYSWIGFLVGFFGNQLSLAGWQTQLSVITGLLLILLSIGQFSGKSIPLSNLPGSLLRRFLGESLYKATPGSQLFTGILNGFLPCGMVYLALAGALYLQNPLDSAIFMASFGLGTLPAMLAVALAGRQLLGRWRLLFTRLSPALGLVFGILLLLRGLSLNIPYLSPQLPTEPTQQIEAAECH